MVWQGVSQTDFECADGEPRKIDNKDGNDGVDDKFFHRNTPCVYRLCA